MAAQDREYPSVWIAELKASLSLRETIERLAGVRFEEGGGRIKACCPFHRERTASFFVDDAAGRYRCFGAGCGKSGDVIQFIADWQSVGFREAVKYANELARLPTPQSGCQPAAMVRGSEREAWRRLARTPRLCRPRIAPAPLPDIPEDVVLPRPNDTVLVHDQQGNRVLRLTPSHVHVYRRADGNPLCLVLRSPTAAGGKFFLQTHWQHENPDRWELLRFDRGSARPVYGMEDLQAWSKGNSTRLLVVEGETTRDAAADLLPAGSSGWLALTAMGGANAVGLADWKPLISELGRRTRQSGTRFAVVVWPDADPPVTDHRGDKIDRQLKFAESVRSSLIAAAAPDRALAGKLDFRRVLPPESAAPGWDIADAVIEGWTSDRLLSHIDRRAVAISGGLRPLQPNGGYRQAEQRSPISNLAELSPAA